MLHAPAPAPCSGPGQAGTGHWATLLTFNFGTGFREGGASPHFLFFHAAVLGGVQRESVACSRVPELKATLNIGCYLRKVSSNLSCGRLLHWVRLRALETNEKSARGLRNSEEARRLQGGLRLLDHAGCRGESARAENGVLEGR